eukprot:scaffold249848_cov47-Prasinocladus_malaysianus.AAC.1
MTVRASQRAFLACKTRWLICRNCQYVLSAHTKAITCVKWGGEGLIYSASQDCTIIAWAADEGKIVRVLK